MIRFQGKSISVLPNHHYTQTVFMEYISTLCNGPPIFPAAKADVAKWVSFAFSSIWNFAQKWFALFRLSGCALTLYICEFGCELSSYRSKNTTTKYLRQHIQMLTYLLHSPVVLARLGLPVGVCRKALQPKKVLSQRLVPIARIVECGWTSAIGWPECWAHWQWWCWWWWYTTKRDQQCLSGGA